ncbi:MAG TPA: chemotaxis-specific protein-glutamate methyltransferase CheB [Polyangiaceae bacterium]
MTERRVRIVVVDDSAVARKFLRDILAARDDFEVVAIARDGLDALERIAELEPDVVTLDLVMPNLDGVGVLEALKERPNRPEVVVVSMAGDDSELGVAALAAGAFEVVKKPTALPTQRFFELAGELCDKVRAAARRRERTTVEPLEELPPARPAVMGAPTVRLVVVGASTGGPQALTQLFRALPADFPVPIAVVLHMPEGYTEAFARRLDADCALRVREASAGLSLEAGTVMVARAGMHLSLASLSERAFVAALGVVPLDTPHRPSVDVLFESAARVVGAGVLGVVLTGMGSDGLAGARAIRAAGGQVLTESERSCVVYGMPRSVFEAGLSSGEASIERMATLIQRSL